MLATLVRVIAWVFQYQKDILQRLIFSKNEVCVNLGTLNATTLIWLVPAVTPWF